MTRSKFKVHNTMFEYMIKNAIIWLKVDRVESVRADMDNGELRIKMYSGEEHYYKSRDENEIIDAHYALTDKFRDETDKEGLVSRTLRKISDFHINMQKMRK